MKGMQRDVGRCHLSSCGVGQVYPWRAQSTCNSGPGDPGVGSLVDSRYVKYTKRETWMQTMYAIRNVCKYTKLRGEA